MSKLLMLILLLAGRIALNLVRIVLEYTIAKAIIDKMEAKFGRNENMNIVDKLLAVDIGKVKTPEKDVTMKLVKLGGSFTFPCKAVDPEYVAELQENSLEFRRGDIEKIKMYDTKVMTIIEGCPSVFKNKSVQDHYKAATPKDLVKMLLVSGEMDNLKAEIDKLGGYDPEKDKEDVKN